MAPLGVEAAAEVLERSVAAVKMQAHRQRISLRGEGERRGLILGQPRGTRLREHAKQVAALRALREDVLAGRVDVARIERRVKLAVAGAPLCPACVKRPQEVESTGLCEVCHLRHLAEGHRLEQEDVEARRELDRERQRKHRRHVKRRRPKKPSKAKRKGAKVA
ncbi:MAG: hypothetical protein ACRDH8_12865 [Actinomycetota bacterium]